MTGMRIAISITLAVLLSGGSCLADQGSSSPFCIVPVRNGAPTDKDHHEAWRMMDKIITLTGVPRPIIYAIDRGGVWTIDENRAFVPFGGEFPFNIFFDKIARDPETSRFVAVTAARGVFALDPGETHFRKLYGVSKDPLQHPYSVEFIPRFKGFVISDASGLYLLDRAGALKPLPIIGLPAKAISGTIFDLPAFDALLINADVQGPAVLVRYDDGQTVLPATLKRFDFIRSVAVEADGTISIRTQFDHRTLWLNPTPRTPIVQGKSFVVEETPVHIGAARIEAPSIGKIIVRDGKSGLAETKPSGPVPIALPFDPAHEPIEGLVEIPEYKAVLIITNASAYVLQDDGSVSEIKGARKVGVSPLTASRIQIIPVRNEAIFLGRNSLNLLVDTRISGEAACNLNYVPEHR
jgi:hypothetical protein